MGIARKPRVKVSQRVGQWHLGASGSQIEWFSNFDHGACATHGQRCCCQGVCDKKDDPFQNLVFYASSVLIEGVFSQIMELIFLSMPILGIMISACKSFQCKSAHLRQLFVKEIAIAITLQVYYTNRSFSE